MGFDVIDRLVEEYRIPQGGVKFNAMYGKGIIGGQQALLMKPLSYMNLSGGPVRDMIHYFKNRPGNRDGGDLRRHRSGSGPAAHPQTGSAGGHNGIKDLIQKLGTQKFIRIRVGVGAKPKDWDLADYVLGRFAGEDRKLVDEAQERACKAVEMILSDGPDAAMNEFNKKSGVV